ncbi:hypothetical protein Taro_036860 [Colocasia esculenta]|uniref:Uncharacterized protein n=1 Tax=Colocasia esculenta TaxID=4460 RepID=A0A843WB19_COLES|nr:hypothetical protein [Colocasia esculenta]
MTASSSLGQTTWTVACTCILPPVEANSKVFGPRAPKLWTPMPSLSHSPIGTPSKAILTPLTGSEGKATSIPGHQHRLRKAPPETILPPFFTATHSQEQLNTHPLNAPVIPGVVHQTLSDPFLLRLTQKNRNGHRPPSPGLSAGYELLWHVPYLHSPGNAVLVRTLHVPLRSVDPLRLPASHRTPPPDVSLSTTPIAHTQSTCRGPLTPTSCLAVRSKPLKIPIQDHMLKKLNKQLSGEEWTWNNLNTLCWAIGSISGSMAEEQVWSGWGGEMQREGDRGLGCGGGGVCTGGGFPPTTAPVRGGERFLLQLCFLLLCWRGRESGLCREETERGGRVLFMVVGVEAGVVVLLLVKTPLRRLVLLGLDRVKRGQGPVAVRTIGATVSVILLSSLYSMKGMEDG